MRLTQIERKRMSKLSKTANNAIIRLNDKADTILFSQKEAATIICIKRTTAKERKHDPFASDKRYIIKTDSNLSGKHDAFYSGYPETISLLTAFLRVGDNLALSWRHDAGNSDLTRDAGLVSDMLYVEVSRKDKRYVSLIARSVTKNNDVRMIKGNEE